MTTDRYTNIDNDATVYDQQSERTTLDNASGTPASKVVAGNKASVKGQPKKDNKWQRVTIGTGSAIVLGAAAAFVASAIPVHAAEPGDAAAPVPGDGNDISMATGVSDDMSFSQAFDAARGEVGPGGVFAWHGNLYNTYTADEWDAMSPGERSEWGSHFEGTYHAQGIARHTDDTQHVPADQAQTDAHQHQPEGGGHDHIDGNTSGHNPQVQPTPDPTPDPNEVEVLGVVHDADNGANYGEIMVGGTDVLLVDVDNDHVFDGAWVDLNGNGQVDDGEVAEVSDLFGRDITVEDLGGFNDPTSNGLLAGGETDYTDDGSYNA